MGYLQEIADADYKMNEALGRVPQCPFRLRISYIPVPFGDFNLLALLYALDRVSDERAKEIDRYAPVFQ